MPKEELSELLVLFDQNFIRRQLDFIYRRIPTNKCERCADCCFASAQVHISEFISLYSYVQELDEEIQKKIASRAVRYELMNLVTLDNKCPFLEEKECLVYEVMPMHCRFFSFYPDLEYSELREESLKQNTALAQYYARNHRLLLSKEVMTYDIEQCGNNVDEKGNKIILSQAERDLFYNQMVSLHNRFLPENILLADEDELNSFTYLYSVIHFPNEELQKLKLEVTKEYLEKKTTNKVDSLIKQYQFDFGMAKVRSIDRTK